MNQLTIDELKQLLKECYSRVPQNCLGKTRVTDYDSAGNTYEFTEYKWSERCREILEIRYEPTGI